jgi:hypothetical protein
MNADLTDEMVAAMDSTADFMHQKPPFVFPPSGIRHDRPAKQYRTPGLVAPYSRGITITGREQGQRGAHRRDALKRGGI